MPKALLVAGVAVVGLGLAYFAWTAINGPIGVSLTSPTPNRGQAATQFQPVDFRLQVSSTDRSGGTVKVQLVFRNTSSQQQRADPQDFSLSGSGQAAKPFFGPGCPNWGRVDLYPPGGDSKAPLRDPEGTRAPATWGPSALCFQDPGGALTLVWEPDVAFGPLSEPIRIPLR